MGSQKSFAAAAAAEKGRHDAGEQKERRRPTRSSAARRSVRSASERRTRVRAPNATSASRLATL